MNEELTNACPKCGAVIDAQQSDESHAIRIHECGSRVHRDGFVVSQSHACAIAELQRDLATTKADLDSLARKAADAERVVEAAESVIKEEDGDHNGVARINSLHALRAALAAYQGRG